MIDMMKSYSRIFITLAFLAVSVTSGAKSTALSTFIEKVAASCVSFDYSFSAKSQGTTMKGDGNVKVQGSAFFLVGNGLEIWCDGKTRWTVDRDAEEAVVENVMDYGDELAANPALLVTSVDTFFTEISFGKSQVGGKTVDVSTLKPNSEEDNSMEIVGLKLYFKTGTSLLTGAWVEFADGTVTDLTISNLKYSERTNEKESFRFDEKTLDSSYVITDLR